MGTKDPRNKSREKEETKVDTAEAKLAEMETKLTEMGLGKCSQKKKFPR